MSGEVQGGTEVGAVRRPAVAIVTLPCDRNYGNLLQKYASERVWRKAGFAPSTLDRAPVWGPWGRGAASVARHVLSVPYHRARHAAGTLLRAAGLLAPRPTPPQPTPARVEAFDRFRGLLHVRPMPRRLPAGLAGDYALLSVGSDQPWNPAWLYDPNYYFLAFAPAAKRVALCPSIGVAQLPASARRMFTRGLAGFAELSVREESGAAIIRQLTGRQATVLADPTLMLTAAEWRGVADGRLTPAGPYVFAYLLGADSPQRAQALEALADGRQVIQISDRDDGTELPAGPAEFIDLVDHAALVVTDSFHACVFATLLATPLVAVPRAGGEGMSGRIDTLAAKLGLARQAVEGSPYPAERLVPGEDLDARLAAERGKFGAYLHGVLESRGFHEQAQLAWTACNAAAAEGTEGAASEGEGAAGATEYAAPASETKEQVVTDIRKLRERERE